MRWIREHTILALAVTSLTLFVLAAAFGTAWAYGTEVGSLADLLAAYATLAAFAAAGVAVYFSHAAFKIEEKRDDRWLQQDRRAQASQVAAWMIDLRRSGLKITGANIQVQNSSEVPVSDFRLTAVAIFTVDGRRIEKFLGDAHKLLIPPGPSKLDLRAPEPFAFAEIPTPNSGSWEGALEISVEASFRDSSGVHWRRRQDGRLTELEDGIDQGTSA